MSERKFARGLGKPGTAAQLRETVSQVVRETTVQIKPHLVEPLDFENFLLKNKTVLQNDPQRELLLYPADDISQVVLPRRYRTLFPNIPNKKEVENCSILTKECINTYSSNWHLVHYKYSAYSGTYLDLPKLPANKLKEEQYEIDIDTDAVDDIKPSLDSVTKEGYLFKGPEIGSERHFVNLGSKSFKRRYCYLRQEVDGTYILELYKDERKGEAKITIVMDFCTEVVKNLKRGRYCFELRMTAGHKSYLLAAESEEDLIDWLNKLTSILHHNKLQEEKRVASLERDRTSPPSSPQMQTYGTLKGLEQSMNPQLIKYARETDISIASARKENRDKFFPLIPQLAFNLRQSASSNQTNSLEPYKEIFGYRVLICCDSIKFKLQVVDEKNIPNQVEPYHTSLCLFDAKAGRKLTENFHFDVNSATIRTTMTKGRIEEDVSNLLPKDVSYEWLAYPQRALLSVSNPHPDIFMVVRIEKVLQGGIYQSSEPYVKAGKDSKINVKTYRNIATSCQRLGNYRMPFAWTARPLFRFTNELDTTSEFGPIYRQEPNKLSDDEMLKILSEYRKPDKFSKFTIIPGSLHVKISSIVEQPQNSLSSSLAPLKPFPLPPASEPIIEVVEFGGSTEKDLHPYSFFVNHLYVYPLSLNFDTQKAFTRARNIACVVELRDSDSADATGLQCIYGRPGQPLLVSSISCSVLHHNTNPCWYEEVKILLPIKILSSHHLLFTFYHVSCDIAKKRENGIESCIGYSWMPITQKGKLSVDMHNLPVAAQLPPGYLSVHPFGLGKGNAGPAINWLDAQKPIFSTNLTLISTVNTKDQHLFNFFSLAERLLDPKPSGVPSDSETMKILKALHAIQLSTLIAFFSTIMNELFQLLIHTTNEDISLNVIRVSVNLIHMIFEAKRTDILNIYVKYVFNNQTLSEKNVTTIHEELCKYLPIILDPTNTDFLLVNKFMHHSNFFFDIIAKSMAQYLLSSGRIKMHRHERFPREYLKKIKELVRIIITYIMDNYKEKELETKELNRSLALFLKRCISLIDRGFIFKSINSYMDKYNPGDPRTLQEFKYNFLEIICSHEHYIAFNLPIQHTKLSPKSRSPVALNEFTLSEEFCKHHFVVGLLLQEVKTSLNEVIQVRKFALLTLRNLMAKHELDDRFETKGQMNRIALIYAPLLNIVIENISRLDVVADKTDEINASIVNPMSSSGSCFFSKSTASESTPKGHRHRFTMHIDKDSPAHFRNSAFYDAIAGQALINGHSLSVDSDISAMSDSPSDLSQETAIVNGVNKSHGRSSSVHINRYDKFQPSEIRDLLSMFLFVVKYLNEDQLVSWWQEFGEGDVINFFTVLELCLNCFKYPGRRNVSVIKSQSTDNVKGKTTKAHTLPARMNPSEINHEGTSTLVIYTNNRDNLLNSVEDEIQKKQQVILEQHLATEVGMIILDCVGLYTVNFKKNLMHSNGDNDMMRKIFDVYLTFLQIGQSESLFGHIFAALRSFINNYSTALFQGNATLCGRLCYELLKHCNSRLSSIRQESCAILYLLMRSNFEFTSRKGLTRVHLQLIISVSQMLGNVIGLNNARFQESLSLINSYATSDKAMKGTGFPIEVKDLTKRIRTVLMATVQMREHHHDPEMLVDLQHSLANSYASTPELRHTWLDNMIKNHAKDGNFSESACCQLHVAALMAEYLKLKGIQDWGAESFAKISKNIAKDEKGLKLDSGVQDIQYTEYILLLQLESCVEYIIRSERYEIVGEVYKLILPMYEKKRDYESLKTAHAKLAQNYEKISGINRSGRRLLGRYYRVAFYGQAYFEEDNAIEYVYKEPKVTSLSEISERLQKQYADKFGAEVIRLIQDSAPVDPSTLDPKFAYVQVTHITPYFEKHELEERQTEFEQNHDINCFMFETPFTKEGKARGNPEEQWKRRTILETSYSFPYVTKRIKVKSKRCLELSPIEVAIDEMQTRVAELEDVVFTKPTDVKKLQLRLQGSVCVQVNAGPLAYATVFLDPALCSMYPEEKVEDLKDVYREFAKICYMALQINSKLIVSEQQEYHEMLQTNYKKLCIALSTMFGEALWPYEETGSFKRNSMALYSAISGAFQNSSTA